MAIPTDNETWLIDRGDEIIAKKAEGGMDALSAWERLVYCLWVADYSIRNAGDLQTANDLYDGYRDELVSLARELGLNQTAAALAPSDEDVVRGYDACFEGICDEIREAERIA